jgi:7-alpha-hydroxysteroid dehydrogenase
MSAKTAAIVTGAGRGIGRAIALALAERGHCVALQSRTLADLEETKAQIEALGGQAICVPGDVTQEESAQELVAKCSEACSTAWFGRPHWNLRQKTSR